MRFRPRSRAAGRARNIQLQRETLALCVMVRTVASASVTRFPTLRSNLRGAPDADVRQAEVTLKTPHETSRDAIAVLALVVAFVYAPFLSAQILETETARPLHAGQFEVGAGYEFQPSREGDETAIPFAFELGITDRLGLLVEPVPYTAIRPKVGQSATGPGDLEITASYLLRGESGRFPAIAIAAEEKVPTATTT